MKLPDFSNSTLFNDLRESMGAPLVDLDVEAYWKSVSFEEEQELATTGIEVPIEDVEVLPDGTFAWKGRRVVVYIREQQQKYYDKGYKFHISECQTVKDMQSSGLYKKRYVVATRDDGNFVINIVSGGRTVKEGLVEPLKVCKNCLKELDFNSFKGNSRSRQTEIVDSFSLSTFLNEGTHISPPIPTYTDTNAPRNVYAKNQPEINRRLKKEARWRCQRCNLNMNLYHSDYYHVHHENGMKSDNRRNNLTALCIHCHSAKHDDDIPPQMKQLLSRFYAELRSRGTYDEAKERWDQC